jgi:hypothetical protein
VEKLPPSPVSEKEDNAEMDEFITSLGSKK